MQPPTSRAPREPAHNGQTMRWRQRGKLMLSPPLTTAPLSCRIRRLSQKNTLFTTIKMNSFVAILLAAFVAVCIAGSTGGDDLNYATATQVVCSNNAQCVSGTCVEGFCVDQCILDSEW